VEAAEQTVVLASEHSATHGHVALEVDVTDVRSILDMGSALAELGGIDYAVNCAGATYLHSMISKHI
jgi:NAD(P)-dependent dehydrogenase (short-subunit alcohol dehydrogenase family)